jgi:hypothetical protein
MDSIYFSIWNNPEFLLDAKFFLYILQKAVSDQFGILGGACNLEIDSFSKEKQTGVLRVFPKRYVAIEAAKIT